MTQHLFDDVGAEQPQEEQVNDLIPEDLGALSSPADEMYSEAMKRLEMAQLYKTIIGVSVFAEGSARPEIQEAVEKELRDFALGRLEVLLGVKQAEPVAAEAHSQFSSDEVAVLKALVARANAARPAEYKPQLNQPVAPAKPKVNQVGTPQPLVQKVGAKPQAKPVQAKQKVSRKQESQNVSEKSGKNYSSVALPTRIPMPSPQAMVAHTIADRNNFKNAATGEVNDSSSNNVLALALSNLGVR